jgi:hypothetical protein
VLAPRVVVFDFCTTQKLVHSTFQSLYKGGIVLCEQLVRASLSTS